MIRGKQFFKDKLNEEFLLLEEFCKMFDNGNISIIPTIALRLRVLFHDTRASTSLLTHSGLTVKHRMLDSCASRSPLEAKAEEVIYLGLSPLALAGLNKGEVVARLDDAPTNWTKFEEWWEMVAISFSEYKLTRKELVLAVANKDGGGHYEVTLAPAYEAIAYLGKHGLVVADISGSDILLDGNSIVNGSIRQIAHEAMKSIKLDYSNYRRNRCSEDLFLERFLIFYE